MDQVKVKMVKLFNKDEDYEKIAKWWIDHDQVPCPIDLLPNIGFIVDDMVVGFLYQTDSGICFVESLVSKKDTNKEERREALDKLMDSLVEVAEGMKYKKIIFHTLHPRIEEQSLQTWKCIKHPGSNERFYRSL